MYKSYCKSRVYVKKDGMFQFVRVEKCVFKMAVTTSKGEVDRSSTCEQDCSAV